jgi:cytochrome c556
MKLRKHLPCVFLFISIVVSAQFVSGSKSLALKGSHTLGAVGDRGGIPVFQMQAHMGAKGVVKERMQLMKSYAASMKKINKEFRDKTSVNYVLIKLEAIDIAESSQKIMELFPPGSGGGMSEASNKIWQQPRDFKKIIKDLNQAAQKLAQATNTGVPNLVIEKFRALGGTCKKCHREYRVKKKG